MAPELGLPEFSNLLIAASRVNPARGDKPGHDAIVDVRWTADET
jgi:hypothetical protein